MIGIYKIENIVNHKVYIGQSHNIESRWVKHINFLNCNNHHNKHLQAAWNKYGRDAFTFSIVEECNAEDLNTLECRYIMEYNSRQNGYNLNDGGDGISGYKHTHQQIEKMRASHNAAVLLQFDLDFKLIKRWVGGIGQAQKELKFTSECVKRRCMHTSKQMSPYFNSYWIFEQEYSNPGFKWERYLNNEKICDVDRGNISTSKAICQYDLNLNLIRTWSSLAELRHAGYNSHQVCAICKHYKGKKTHKGYVWAYYGYDFSDGYFDDRISKRIIIKYRYT